MSDLTFTDINIEKTLDYHHFILVNYGDMIFFFFFFLCKGNKFLGKNKGVYKNQME